MTPKPEEASGELITAASFEYVGKVVALTAALLPVMGGLIRYGAFLRDDELRGAASQAFSSASVIDLTGQSISAVLSMGSAVAMFSYLVTSGLLAAVAMTIDVQRRYEKTKADSDAVLAELDAITREALTTATDEATPALARRIQRVRERTDAVKADYEDIERRLVHRLVPRAKRLGRRLVLANVVLVVGVLLVGRGFPWGALPAVAAGAAAILFVRSSIANGQIRLRQQWPGLILILAATTLSEVAYYRFPEADVTVAADSPIASGRFAIVGQRDDVLLLHRCSSPGSGVVAVHTADVTVVAYPPLPLRNPLTSTNPSLLDVLVTGAAPNLRPAPLC